MAARGAVDGCDELTVKGDAVNVGTDDDVLVACPAHQDQAIGDARIEIEASQETSGSAPIDPAWQGFTFPMVALWAAVVALVATLIVREAHERPAPADPLANLQISRLTDWEGTEGEGVISPDGRFVAFIADKEGELEI